MESKYKVPSFLKRDDESLLFNNNEGELIFFVPDIYFTRGDAVEYGDFIDIIGVFDYTITDKNGKYTKLHNFRFPTVFQTKPYEIEFVKGLKLTKDTEPQDYRLLKYQKNDVVVVSVKVPQNVVNMEQFFKLAVINSRIPSTVPYDKFHEYFIENAKLNGSSYSLSLQLFGILISKVVRDKKDISKPFRLAKSTNMHDYVTMSVADIPKYMSPYAAVTSQNWDEAVMAAVLSKEKDISPMQQIMMG